MNLGVIYYYAGGRYKIFSLLQKGVWKETNISQIKKANAIKSSLWQESDIVICDLAETQSSGQHSDLSITKV